MAESRTPLVAIVGPTGAGKSELALLLAAQFRGEIVNCDSLQVYRHLDIGTAKLLPNERRGMPHHLIDIVNPDRVFTAGQYARLARPLLAEIAARGALPIVVGGTGLYLRALLDGLFPGPERNERLRARLARREARRPGWLHRLLARFDPQAAGRIHSGDVRKLIRAVEVLLVTRKPLSSWLGERGRDPLRGFRVLKLGLGPPRDALYQRLNVRCERMFKCGLIEEVTRVLALGFRPDSKALESHGYRQAVQVLEGEIDATEALRLAQRNTRRYAKRQWTWFRRDAGVSWLPGFGDEPAVAEEAVRRVREFIASQAV